MKTINYIDYKKTSKKTMKWVFNVWGPIFRLSIVSSTNLMHVENPSIGLTESSLIIKTCHCGWLHEGAVYVNGNAIDDLQVNLMVPILINAWQEVVTPFRQIEVHHKLIYTYMAGVWKYQRISGHVVRTDFWAPPGTLNPKIMVVDNVSYFHCTTLS